MSLDAVYEMKKGLYFFPAYDAGQWTESLLDELIVLVDWTVNALGAYISLDRRPDFILISDEYEQDFKRMLGISPGITAVTSGSNIFFFSKNSDHWKRLLRHELFHVGVNQMLGKDATLVPEWFNESVAYYLGKNTAYNKEVLLRYIVTNHATVITIMHDDLLLSESRHALHIIKSFGKYFCDKYLPYIKDIVIKTGILKSFDRAVDFVLGTAITTIIKNWMMSIYYEAQ